MYTKAILEIVEFDLEDVITTSGGTVVKDPDDPWADGGGDTSTEAPDK